MEQQYEIIFEEHFEITLNVRATSKDSALNKVAKFLGFDDYAEMIECKQWTEDDEPCVYLFNGHKRYECI